MARDDDHWADTRRKLGAISRAMLAQMQEADERDAIRYRWLRDLAWETGPEIAARPFLSDRDGDNTAHIAGEELDAAIDAAMRGYEEAYGDELRAVLIPDAQVD